MWVTATGAFLLFAAASLFVAVRWDTLGDQVKLAILAGITGAGLLAGRLLRPSLPVTARVLTHLGALLVPLDVAAVALHVLRGGSVEPLWPPVLALTACSAAVVWWVAGRVEQSSLLRALAAVAVVPAAAGVAGTFGWSAPLLLVGAAVVACALDVRRPALGWATVAGLGPVLAAVGELAELPRLVAGSGLDAAATGVLPALVGVAAAAVVAVVARRSDQAGLLLVSLGSLAVAGGALRSGSDLEASIDVLALAALVLLIELAALAGRHDPFWERPLSGLAAAVEWLAGLAVVPVAFAAVVVAAIRDGHDLALVEAGALAGIAWLVADLRRGARDRALGPWVVLVGGGWAPAVPAVVVSVVAGVVAGTASPVASGVVALALCGLAVVGGRPLAHLVTAGVAPAAALAVAAGDPELGLACAVAATVLVGWTAALRAAIGSEDAVVLSRLLVLASLAPVVVAAPLVLDSVDPEVVAAAVVAAWWLVSVVVRGADRVEARGTDLGEPGPAVDALAVVPRAATGVALGWLALATGAGGGAAHPLVMPSVLLGAAGLAVVLTLVDVVRALVHDRMASDDELVVLPVAVPALLAAGLWSAGYPTTEVGVGLAVLALVGVGIHVLAGARAQLPVLAEVAVAAAGALAAASGDAAALATVLLLLGGAALAEAVVQRSVALAVAAGGLLTAGVWGHLGVAEVEAADAWAAPVALCLAAAGAVASRRGASSWVTAAPAVALLGGTALAERLAGGGGIHAVVVGAVGVTAVALGGARRLAAPLLLGTAALVVLTVSESMRYTAGVPTWAWLALGGTVLVGIGIALERHETGPLEAGERLVDVVRTRYR